MKKGKGKYIIGKLLWISMIAVSSILIYQIFQKLKNAPQNENYYGVKLSAASENKGKEDISDILEKVTSNVVGISKIKNMGSVAFLSNATKSLGLGSGIILSTKGYIVTNQHVVGEKSEDCYVTTEAGEKYTGKVIWTNSDIDIAIIKVNATFQQEALLGNSDSIKVGQNVYAIGNPIGFEFQTSVTGGIISAVNRTVKVKNEDESYSYMSNLIQTDATINPGNSGGPLVDCEGKIIGMNTIKITTADGMGFAIPINIVKPILEKYEQKGVFKEAYLGIYAYDSSVISYVNTKEKNAQGVYIEKIVEEGPASFTELQKGDRIIKIDQTNISKMSDLWEYIFKKEPEEEVLLTIIRNEKERVVKVQLGKK